MKVEIGDCTYYNEGGCGEGNADQEGGVVLALLGVIVRLPRAARHGQIVHRGGLEVASVVAAHWNQPTIIYIKCHFILGVKFKTIHQ